MYKMTLDVSAEHTVEFANSGCTHAEMGHSEDAIYLLDTTVLANGDFATMCDGVHAKLQKLKKYQNRVKVLKNSDIAWC